jgi:hypothetical protein
MQFLDPADTEPIEIDIKRIDEMQYLRLVVANRSFSLLAYVAVTVPSRELLESAGRSMRVSIEPGASRLSEIYANEHDTFMEFLLVNSQRLRALVERAAATAESRKKNRWPVTPTAAALEPSTVATTTTTTIETVSEHVPCTIITAQQFVDNERFKDQEAAIEAVLQVTPSFDSPLPEFLHFVQFNDVTPYEADCYARRRLIVLLNAYQAYYLARDDEERQAQLAGLKLTNYPIRSGTSYYMLSLLGQEAITRQNFHEGIGLAMLCLCAKHSAALRENLLLMEMCLLEHFSERGNDAFERNRIVIEDDDRESVDDADGQDSEKKRFAELDEKIARHTTTINDFWTNCRDIFAASTVADPRFKTGADAAGYPVFFNSMHALTAEWKDALERLNEERSRPVEELSEGADGAEEETPPFDD